jgi:hypothetical protein
MNRQAMLVNFAALKKKETCALAQVSLKNKSN